MPDRKVSRVTVVSWCCSLRLRGLRPSVRLTVETHLGFRSAHCANWLRAAHPLEILGRGDVMVRVCVLRADGTRHADGAR
eukprot:4000118-Prymnesium_polylepis.1